MTSAGPKAFKKKDEDELRRQARDFVVRWHNEHPIFGNKISKFSTRPRSDYTTTHDLLVEMLVAFHKEWNT